MNLKTIFKRLILLDLLLIILIIVSVFFESEEVADFNKYFESEFSNSLLIIFGILMLIYLINLFLLYKFKSIGKQMYLILFVLLIVLTLLSPQSAMDPWLYVIDGLGWANSGAILILLYFSPIKKEFEK
jgi:ABC-type glycerol-3-phosphate transport system permease component|tara:strand:+ start:483 stop:869 length:387 start_codon:yes stop_codon:yes gene_type:complete